MLIEGNEPQLFCFGVFCQPVMMSVMSAFIWLIASSCQLIKVKEWMHLKSSGFCMENDFKHISGTL